MDVQMRKCHGVPPEFLCTMFMVEFSTPFIELLIHNVANLMQFISCDLCSLFHVVYFTRFISCGLFHVVTVYPLWGGDASNEFLICPCSFVTYGYYMPYTAYIPSLSMRLGISGFSYSVYPSFSRSLGMAGLFYSVYPSFSKSLGMAGLLYSVYPSFSRSLGIILKMYIYTQYHAEQT